MKNTFDTYYKKFLGIESSKEYKEFNIITSNQRTIPVNKKYHHLFICTKLENKIFISISPYLYPTFNKFTNDILNKNNIQLSEINFEFLYNLLNQFIKSIDMNYSVRYMYRMTKSNDIDYNVRDSKNIIELPEYKKYVILKNQKILSYSKISNIDCSGANIVVWTDEEYRKKGFGKTLVKHTLNKCFRENLIPIYLVHRDNINSIKLAKSLNFEIKNQEIIVTAY
jgi:RimJ/RimL family protein N-acetyltransferase